MGALVELVEVLAAVAILGGSGSGSDGQFLGDDLDDGDAGLGHSRTLAGSITYVATHVSRVLCRLCREPGAPMLHQMLLTQTPAMSNG